MNAFYVQKKALLNGTSLKILQGDIVKQQVEAIVNAANPFLEPGGGVDGKIHQAAGPDLSAACKAYKDTNDLQTIKVTEAVLTDAYKITEQVPSLKYVIHVVGPDCRIAAQRDDKERLLGGSYINAMNLAKEHGIKSIAFPAISTGAYSYPLWEAQHVVMQVVKDYLENHPFAFEEVNLVYFSEIDFQNALRVWEEIIE